MNQRALRRFAFISILMLSAVSFAQQLAPAPEMPKDTITAIFTGEFGDRVPPPPRWFDGGQSYITTEPAASGHGRDLVKYDTATGKNREVLITAVQLTPEGAKEPLQIAGLSWSKDNQRVLIFTNTAVYGAPILAETIGSWTARPASSRSWAGMRPKPA